MIQILTVKIKHCRDFSEYLRKAALVAEFAIKNRDKRSSKDVKQFGLPSRISNQILRKYGKNLKAQKIKSVPLIIPNQGIKFNSEYIFISCLDLKIKNEIKFDFNKINQIEINDTYCFISVSVTCPNEIKIQGFIGVDLNATGHVCVAANPLTGKILKMGKNMSYIRKKYLRIRAMLQKNKKFRQLKKMNHKERRIVNDLNHKMTSKIVKFALQNECGIRLENLKHIKENKKYNKSVNTWASEQIRTFIEYKAHLHGVPVEIINPYLTSQVCSKCGKIGERNAKVFICSLCGNFEHADVNAAFNIATSLKRV